MCRCVAGTMSRVSGRSPDQVRLSERKKSPCQPVNVHVHVRSLIQMLKNSAVSRFKCGLQKSNPVRHFVKICQSDALKMRKPVRKKIPVQKSERRKSYLSMK